MIINNVLIGLQWHCWFASRTCKAISTLLTPPTALNDRGGSGFTYGMLSRAGLLERGGEGYRRHHGHGLPLLRLLADVDGVSGERFERRAEAVERVGPPVFSVVLLHDTAFFPPANREQQTGCACVCVRFLRLLSRCGAMKRPFNARCALRSAT